ncbi:hypothetical protein PCANC_18382 [Puccinia coronata f. sp. avenae]|uniref:Uncharacterized protein n=1 Tax=Puccinia coronata f. sp. avenae TaxID=200324 RepID=A0A2N5V1E1_9BASI|nr:hypothetical protein PCANC_18382 [Puccinia coronata f. sp. avenae]
MATSNFILEVAIQGKLGVGPTDAIPQPIQNRLRTSDEILVEVSTQGNCFLVAFGGRVPRLLYSPSPRLFFTDWYCLPHPTLLTHSTPLQIKPAQPTRSQHPSPAVGSLFHPPLDSDPRFAIPPLHGQTPHLPPHSIVTPPPLIVTPPPSIITCKMSWNPTWLSITSKVSLYFLSSITSAGVHSLEISKHKIPSTVVTPSSTGGGITVPPAIWAKMQPLLALLPDQTKQAESTSLPPEKPPATPSPAINHPDAEVDSSLEALIDQESSLNCPIAKSNASIHDS